MKVPVAAMARHLGLRASASRAAVQEELRVAEATAILFPETALDDSSSPTPQTDELREFALRATPRTLGR